MSQPVSATAADVEYLIVTELAKLRQRDPATIDPSRMFNELAVDSLDAVSLTGLVAETYGITLDPTELYEFPSPRALAARIAQKLKQP